GQANFTLRRGAEVEMRRSLLLNSDKQHGLARIATNRGKMRPDHPGNLLQALFHITLRGRKRVALPGGEHALNPAGRYFVEPVVIEHADPGKADRGLSAQ